MSAVTQDTAVRTGAITRTFIYLILVLFALLYLLPFFVMLVNSVKPRAEITGGNMLALPKEWTIAPWLSAWSTAQIVLIPMARMLGIMGLAGTLPGLILVHVVYGLGFTALYFRNYYASFPTELVRAAMIDGAGFFRIFWRIMLPVSVPIAVVSVIWQFTNIWNDFLFGASFSGQNSTPMTVALNNLVQSSTGVKEYNVHFAGAILAALPTLFVYIVAGRYFVRGLMAGSVKG